jgi:hypothetical protein
LLVLLCAEIPVAFEVTTSVDAAREAINDRFRDLFTVLHPQKIRVFVAVKDKDLNKAAKMINSTANVRTGISAKICVVKMSYLTRENFKSWVS